MYCFHSMKQISDLTNITLQALEKNAKCIEIPALVITFIVKTQISIENK